MELRRKAFNIYTKMPHSAKRVISGLGRILPPEYVYGKDFLRTTREIQDTQHLSGEEIQRLQLEKLKKILLHAFHSTDYYRNDMLAKNITEEMIMTAPERVLTSIGFTDKALIIQNPKDFISSKARTIWKDYVSTGGTTGQPFYFYIDSSRSSKEWAFLLDMWGRVGFVSQSRRATFRGSAIKSGDWEDDPITRERKFSSFDLTDEYLTTVWQALHQYSPDFIYAYPSTALFVCQFMDRAGKQLPPTVKAFLLGSENIYEGQREFIETISERRVFLWYGQSEKVALAGECEKSHSYHAYPQYSYVEFLNERGQAAQPGEFAEIVGTGFLNTVMPFIRYRTGDYCTYLGYHCPQCGRRYHIFSDVRGRWTQEVLYGVKGNSICMSAINVHSNNFRNVFRFQFFQDEPGRTILKIVPRQGFSERDKKAIEKEFNEKFGNNVVVRVILVDDIESTRMGKFKFIDQKIPIQTTTNL